MNAEDIFRTPVEINESRLKAMPDDTVFSIGSCFAETMSQKLADGLMQSFSNPFGTAYNPITIDKQILRIVNLERCSADEIVGSEGRYLSFKAHSKLWADTPEELADAIDRQTAEANRQLSKAKLIVITYGTAWVYALCSSGSVVANCHKLPADKFTRRRLTADEITATVLSTVGQIRRVNANARIVFTVSPIRHLKDTAHGNQLSKAELLLGIDSALSSAEGTEYFPAYEIQMDELRDYRFYAADMLHPSEVAADYIFDRFAQTYLTNEARQLIAEGRKITSALQHRPMGTETQYLQFIDSTIGRIDRIRAKYDKNLTNNCMSGVYERLSTIRQNKKK
ncbi:MAG: GSCFA domain-containing protein [Bacteroidales bacterium]|nr:GSCFA domain-containing protein [Bacteroidales bacterium]